MIEIKPRIRLKFEYQGRTFWGRAGMPMRNRMGWQIPDNRPHCINLRVTFTETGASGTMYVSPDALPSKYGME